MSILVASDLDPDRIRPQKSGSRSDQKGPDPTGSGSATLLMRKHNQGNPVY
jgi:hypothetical protein